MSKKFSLVAMLALGLAVSMSSMSFASPRYDRHNFRNGHEKIRFEQKQNRNQARKENERRLHNTGTDPRVKNSRHNNYFFPKRSTKPEVRKMFRR